MTDEEILEGNQIIAEFLGWTLRSRYHHLKRRKVYEWIIPKDSLEIFYEHNDGFLEVYEERFHQSWDWLMPVVEKICSTKLKEGLRLIFDMNPVQQNAFLQVRKYELNRSYPIVRYYPEENLDVSNFIEHIYKACIEFIKWYNDNK